MQLQHRHGTSQQLLLLLQLLLTLLILLMLLKEQVMKVHTITGGEEHHQLSSLAAAQPAPQDTCSNTINTIHSKGNTHSWSDQAAAPSWSQGDNSRTEDGGTLLYNNPT
jgi:hypothetical protein